MALATTGEIPALEKLRAKFPPGLVEMTKLPGLGPKRARRLYEELGIDSLDSLREAADGRTHQRAQGLRRQGRAGAARGGRRPTRRRDRRSGSCSTARSPSARSCSRRSARTPSPSAPSSPARRGAWPRASRTSTSSRRRAIPARWPRRWPGSRRSRRPRPRARTRCGSGPTAAINVDVRIVEPDQFGNVLQHLTGSKQHNVALRDFAVRRGLHISEYGVLDDSTGSHPPLRRPRHEVYALLGMDYIEPELREDRGELEAALNGTLPELVTAADLKGDLHCHTTASDGTASIEEMAAGGARRRLRVPGDHRPLGVDGLRRRRLSGPAQAPDRADPRGRRDAPGAHAARRARRSTSCPTARSTIPTSCWPSSTGSWPAFTPRSGCPRPR